MPDNISIRVEGDKELVARFEGFKDLAQSPKLAQALLGCSMIVERKAKENLLEMVYSTPEITYKRKVSAGLLGSTMGSLNPGSAGFSNPYFNLVQTIGTGIVSFCVSLVHYAAIVHFGFGVGRNAFPRAYFTKALQDAKPEILEEIKKAIL
jgi:hypothetical protein